jgi:pilus assembly protein CpaB
MKSRTIILLAIAVVCGLGAAYLTTRLTARQPEGETTDVLVAKDNILQGTLLKEPDKFFETRKYKKDEVPPGAKSPKDIKDIQNRQLRRGLPAKLPLTDWHLGKAMGVAVTLPDGHRAMSLPANVNKDAGGFILPNTRVDVICTVQEGDKSRSQTILQNVLIMAVNQMEDPPEGTGALVPHNVTLAVKPDEAERLALAVNRGSLLLTLRKAGDEERFETTGVRDLFATPGETTTARPVETVQVAVATRDIAADTVIDNPRDYFQIASFPKSLAPSEPIIDLNFLRDKKAAHKIHKAQFVLKGDLLERDETVATAPVEKPVPPKEEDVFVQVLINGAKTETNYYDKKTGALIRQEKAGNQ